MKGFCRFLDRADILPQHALFEDSYNYFVIVINDFRLESGIWKTNFKILLAMKTS